jgi:hypothetical protein
MIFGRYIDTTASQQIAATPAIEPDRDEANRRIRPAAQPQT